MVKPNELFSTQYDGALHNDDIQKLANEPLFSTQYDGALHNEMRIVLGSDPKLFSTQYDGALHNH